jgi:hypothetical protein
MEPGREAPLRDRSGGSGAWNPPAGVGTQVPAQARRALVTGGGYACGIQLQAGRQYEHVKASANRRGASTGRAKQIAARTVNKERARSGRRRPRARVSTKDTSSSRQDGQLSSAAECWYWPTLREVPGLGRVA